MPLPKVSRLSTSPEASFYLLPSRRHWLPASRRHHDPVAGLGLRRKGGGRTASESEKMPGRKQHLTRLGRASFCSSTSCLHSWASRSCQGAAAPAAAAASGPPQSKAIDPRETARGRLNKYSTLGPRAHHRPQRTSPDAIVRPGLPAAFERLRSR